MSIRKHFPILLLCLVGFVYWMNPVHASEEKKTTDIKVALTDEEKQWIAEHPTIRVNGDEWPPFVIREPNGQFTGISIDLRTSETW